MSDSDVVPPATALIVTRVLATEAAVALVRSRTHFARTGALTAVIVIVVVMPVTNEVEAEVVADRLVLDANGMEPVAPWNPWLRTNAVVASWVVLVPTDAVGAVGIPVNAGELRSALALNVFQSVDESHPSVLVVD